MTTTISGPRLTAVATTAVQAPSALTPAGTVTPNKAVTKTLKAMAQAAGDGAASSTMFLPAAGTKFDAWAFSYHTNLPKEMNIKGIREGQVVQGHICINVSGHASGGRAEQLVAFALQKLARAGADLSTSSPKNDQLFAALHAAARGAGWSGDATLKVDGLPDVQIAAAELQQFAATDEGKWSADEALRRHFALTNTYHVRVTLPDGRRLEMRDVARNRPQQAEYATSIPIAFPAMKGNTVVEAWPTGSAEVAGYVEARRYHVHIGEENFYNEKAALAAVEKYMDAHPQIRWAARAADPGSDEAWENEEADLKKHRVAPAPMPYADLA
jgi:hypothetical protein